MFKVLKNCCANNWGFLVDNIGKSSSAAAAAVCLWFVLDHEENVQPLLLNVTASFILGTLESHDICVNQDSAKP